MQHLDIIRQAFRRGLMGSFGYTVLLGMVVAAFVMPTATAVSLGGVKVKSQMGQPFEAVIPIIGRPQDLSGLVVRLAPGDDYKKLGVDYQYFLRHIRGEMQVDDKLRPLALRLFSRVPMFEPEIRVILEAVWPEGRFLRSYVILVNPSENIHEVSKSANRLSQGSDPQSGGMVGEVFVIREGEPAPATQPLLDQYWANPPTPKPAPRQSATKRRVVTSASKSTPPPINPSTPSMSAPEGAMAVGDTPSAVQPANKMNSEMVPIDNGATIDKQKQLADINAQIDAMKKRLSETPQ